MQKLSRLLIPFALAETGYKLYPNYTSEQRTVSKRNNMTRTYRAKKKGDKFLEHMSAYVADFYVRRYLEEKG